MRTNGKKISAPAKEKKQPAKLRAKRSKQSLLQSRPTETAPVKASTADRGSQRWLFGLAASALVLAVVALIASSDFFRTRGTQAAANAASVTQPNEQTLPSVQTMLIAPPLRVETPAPVLDPEADARNDYMLALATGTTEAIDLFLARHPKGFHAELARVQRAKFVEFELPATVRQLNAELKRVGCGPVGTLEWTQASQQALASFNRHAKTNFDVKAPNAAALKEVKERGERVCPAAQPAKAAEAAPAKQKRFFFWE